MTLRATVLAVLVSEVALGAWSTPAERPPSPLPPPAPPTPVSSALPASRPARPRWLDVTVEPRPPMTEKLLALGDRLYGWNCMPCHGADGKGDGPVGQRLGLRPRDYTLGLFKLKMSLDGEAPFDEDLYRTITTGLPASGMPSFASFEPSERWALVEQVKSLAVRTLEDGSVARPFQDRPARHRFAPPEAGPIAAPGRGASLFRTVAQCSSCHGEKGKGDGPTAALLRDPEGRPVAVPDLTRGEILFKAGDRPEDVFRVLTIGMLGSPMASFAILPERDRRELASYVVSLFEPIPEGERAFLERRCRSCHTVGKGRLVGPDLAGVASRRPREWLRAWLRDPPRMLLDDRLRAEFKDYPAPMPNLNLGEEEIETLVGYLEGLPAAPGGGR